MITWFVTQSWKFWFIFLLILIAIFWLFLGGGNHQFVGLSPLSTDVDSSKYIDPSTLRNLEQHIHTYDNQNREIDNNTEENYTEENYTEDLNENEGYTTDDPNLDNEEIYEPLTPGPPTQFLTPHNHSHNRSHDHLHNELPFSNLDSSNQPEYLEVEIAQPCYENDHIQPQVDTTPKIPISILEYVRVDDMPTTPGGSSTALAMAGQINKKIARTEVKPEVKQEVVKSFINNRSFRSKGESVCCRFMERKYGKPFISVRPNFLKNPETGANMEIDCYNDELKLGIEYNGSQHYVWPNYTNQTYEDFIKQIRRDRLKVELCDANDVYLITVPYNVPHNMIDKYIEYHLPESVEARLLAAEGITA